MSNTNLICPVCGGEITESEKAFGCSNWRDSDGGCKFVIWKKICGKDITLSMAKTLLQKGQTNMIKGFVSNRTGKDFDAALKLAADDSYKVVFVFE